MTPKEWQEHAARCREVAATLDDAVARRVLLEAAEDYAALARREAANRNLEMPLHQIGAPARLNRMAVCQG